MPENVKVRLNGPPCIGVDDTITAPLEILYVPFDGSRMAVEAADVTLYVSAPRIGGPVGPVTTEGAPVGPEGPVEPEGPEGPEGPVRPVGPEGPVKPDGPI